MLKFRTVRKDRTVPHTVGGQTYDVTEPHESLQLVQPRDMDAIVSRLLWVLTVLVVCAALVWSTVAIGHLLSLMAPVWVSYLVAVVFDMAWVTCMAAEWLMRYDRTRARVAYWAGWAFLAVSVLAISTDGALSTGKPVIGAAGGMVSVISKGLWMVVMSISAQRLSPLDQQWYEKANSALTAELALTRARRKLARVKALQAQEKAALDAILADPPVAGSLPFDLEPAPVPEAGHEPLVYVIRNGNRVKIGTTTNLSQRIKHLSLRQKDLLLTLDGGPELERDLHQRFQDYRAGTSEWFDFVPEIRDFVRDAQEGRTVLSAGQEDRTETPVPTPERDDLQPRRDLTDLVRDLRAQGLDEEEIKGRVRDEVPDVKADSLRKSLRRTRTV
jgi:hypothetical protein